MKLDKIIRKVLKEAVGVPENIVETAELIYQQIIDKLKSINLMNYEDDEGNANLDIVLEGDYRISDYRFKFVDLKLEIISTNQLDSPAIAGMSFIFSNKLDNNTLNVVYRPSKNKINLSITIGIPENYGVDSALELLEDEKQTTVTSLTHELMHSYDKYKNPKSSLTSRADYDTYQNIRFGIKPVDEFLHKLYFIHSIENVVRPSEIASDLKLGKIDKKGFLDFLKNNRVYKILKDINNFSYDNFKKELLNYTEIIRDRLEQSRIEDIPDNDEELVEFLLNLLRINLNNGKANSLKRDLTTDFIEDLIGFSGKKEQVFNNYLKRITKYENTDDFFRNEEKMFKIISYNLMKKIHKLYSLLSDNKETNESIIDWELHHKLKKTPFVIETEFKYTPEERKLKLIQNYLDNVLVPGNKLICKSNVVRLVNQDEYLVSIWVNKNEPHSQDDSDNLVDDTWDEIYNMFEVPVSVQRINSEC